MSGYGKSSTKWCIRWAAPRYMTPASPKSAWASPGCHTRSMNASAGSQACPRRTRATALVTVDSDTSAPCSSRSRSHTLVAVCRCLRQLAPSSASHCSTRGIHWSMTDARLLRTGGFSDRSSSRRYLRTVGSLTPVLRAIDATVSPFLRRRRIDCIWGMLIICLSGLS